MHRGVRGARGVEAGFVDFHFHHNLMLFLVPFLLHILKLEHHFIPVRLKPFLH
ncbi:Portal protein [Clarias magur]|uniref:Portal protein n=1 Tax=Clarias magur TaxID=1594786 RepID=A0A8J4X7J6_CLAMG|nr:Portal protein [Clarias magur]